MKRPAEKKKAIKSLKVMTKSPLPRRRNGRLSQGSQKSDFGWPKDSLPMISWEHGYYGWDEKAAEITRAGLASLRSPSGRRL
jgi:hypothetical protein